MAETSAARTDAELQHLCNALKKLTEFERDLNELKTFHWTDEEGNALQSVSDSTSEAKKHLLRRVFRFCSPILAEEADFGPNRSAPDQKFGDKCWSWILDRASKLGNFAAAVAVLWLMTKVSGIFSETTVPDSNTVNPTDRSPKPKRTFATIVAQKGLQQILDGVQVM